MGSTLIPVAGNNQNDSSGASQSLPPTVQHRMESQFGQDFSNVRVHTDPQSTVASRAVGAAAFTCGSDIYFSPGAYQPQSESGLKLLAHELTHVVQQTQGPGVSVPKGTAIVETEK